MTPEHREWLEEMAEDDDIPRWGPNMDKVSLRAALAELDAKAARVKELEAQLAEARNKAFEESMAVARRWSNKSKAAVCEAIHEDIRALIQKPEGANG